MALTDFDTAGFNWSRITSQALSPTMFHYVRRQAQSLLQDPVYLFLCIALKPYISVQFARSG